MELTTGKQREMVEILKRRCPGFATMRHLVLSFRGILCGGKASSLKRWAEKAEASGLEAIRGFGPALEEGLGRRAKRGETTLEQRTCGRPH
jgi:hypothetical protein